MNEEVKKILCEGCPKQWDCYLTGKEKDNCDYWDDIAQQICWLFPKTKENPDGYEPELDEVDPRQVVGHGGEVDESDLTLEETEAAVLAVLKPDEDRLLKPETIAAVVKNAEMIKACEISYEAGRCDGIIREREKKDAECQERVDELLNPVAQLICQLFEPKREIDALRQENGVLANALRRLLICCGVLNTDTIPSGPELVMATEEYIVSKGGKQ